MDPMIGETQKQRAQAEFEQIRAQLPQLGTHLASPRLRIVSDKFMRKRGGAAAIYFWTCISENLLQAPDDVRRAVVAHECSHIAKGHCLVSKLALALALVYGIHTFSTPPTGLNVCINIALLTLVTGLTAWSLLDTREYEADHLAASIVGPETMATAIRWIIDQYRDGEQNEVIQERLRRLDAQAIAKTQGAPA